MIDPLGHFSWSNLYPNYDALCVRFNPSVPYLEAFSPRPVSDRLLYYALTQKFALELNSSKGISLETFQAMLYWKLYSQPAAVANTCRRLMQDRNLRQQVSQGLAAASRELSSAEASDVKDVVAQVKKLGTYVIWGMKSSTALPVRTTFLHFVHPARIPIFDKQVLLAIGVHDKRANESLAVLEAYTAYSRKLAGTHSTHFSQFHDESPIRLIDMALWVVRGGCN